MKKIGEQTSSNYEYNYQAKEAIDWDEIEQARRQHDPQSTVLNILFGIFDLINFII